MSNPNEGETKPATERLKDYLDGLGRLAEGVPGGRYTAPLRITHDGKPVLGQNGREGTELSRIVITDKDGNVMTILLRPPAWV